MKPERCLWALGVVLGGVLGGCAGAREVFAPGEAPEYLVVRESALYRRGPAQPGRPDRVAAQEIVRLSARDPDYAMVALEDGRTGFMATEDLRPAPPRGQAVDEMDLFPERFARVPDEPLPEPDLALPVQDIPSAQ